MSFRVECRYVMRGTPKTLGERLLWARTNAGMTTRQAADAAGIAASMICHYEKYGREPGVNTAAALAAVYGVSLEWLATGRNTRGRG